MADSRKVAVAGLGSIGLRVAAALDQGIEGLELTAVSARDAGSAAARLATFRNIPELLPLAALPDAADIVVECLPPSAFAVLGGAMLKHDGKTFVVASVGQLLIIEGFLDQARAAGLRILAPSGAVAGIDGLRAAREIGLEAVTLKTRKPPGSFGEAVASDGGMLATETIDAPVRVFSGSARQSIAAFPRNINVAATVALAGLGADATSVEIWADPGIGTNIHELTIRSKGGTLRVASENLPDAGNPKSSAITAYSIIAALRRMDGFLSVGS
ncbi:aspartate dehydrogenase domain-containing protein [Martelella soudanensis]|uniref:aspartate dehydrogenase domain-containing protein n=1 Tax=unclassified Martelella TaxID=2629616 RepID=UPI0015DF48C2|nr:MULTISPECIES: aspartate dehydrogenase domain-containing protein [unclassified Martelella]